MSKLDDIKAKLATLRTSIVAIIVTLMAKVPFLKKYSSKIAYEEANLPKETKVSEPGLGAVYREGNSSTRLAVAFVFILFAAFVYFAGGVIKRNWQKYTQSKNFHVMEKEYSEKVAKEMERVATSASVVSLGHFATNAVTPGGKKVFLNVDIWVVCESPDTAKYLEDAGIRMHNLVIDVLQNLFQKDLSPVTNEGREYIRVEVMKAINSKLTHGKVLDVNIYNLIIE